MTRTRGRAASRVRVAILVTLAACASFAAAASAGMSACDTENTCATSCRTGTRFSNDGTCACEPFDAGYCGSGGDCPDAYCPASNVPDACGGGQLWSTAICGCYPLPEGGLRSRDAGDAGDAHADH